MWDICAGKCTQAHTNNKYTLPHWAPLSSQLFLTFSLVTLRTKFINAVFHHFQASLCPSAPSVPTNSLSNVADVNVHMYTHIQCIFMYTHVWTHLRPSHLVHLVGLVHMSVFRLLGTGEPNFSSHTCHWFPVAVHLGVGPWGLYLVSAVSVPSLSVHSSLRSACCTDTEPSQTTNWQQYRVTLKL